MAIGVLMEAAAQGVTITIEPLNPRDALDAGAIEKGQKILLFSYGYGAHWTGMAVEA